MQFSYLRVYPWVYSQQDKRNTGTTQCYKG